MRRASAHPSSFRASILALWVAELQKSTHAIDNALFCSFFQTSAHATPHFSHPFFLHRLGRLANTTEGRVALSLVDCFNIPKDAGDCTVLILLHPGTNELGHYFPPSHINPLLLPWIPPQKSRPTSATNHPAINGDVDMFGTSPDVLSEPTTTPRELLFSGGTASVGRRGIEIEQMDSAGPTIDGDAEEEGSCDAESWDIMDLASFLEFAVSASHCLETLHKAGIIHREIRPNSFHVNAHSGVVRFAHFGNRSVSLERLGGPSSLVIEAGELPEWKQRKVKEAMCYLAPEQTGTAETVAEDHRTDLYALGVLFWALLVGHGRLPFEGSAMELLHSVVQKQPAYVHEARRDVPEVLSKIVDKVSHSFRSTVCYSYFSSSLRKAPMDGTIPPLG